MRSVSGSIVSPPENEGRSCGGPILFCKHLRFSLYYEGRRVLSPSTASAGWLAYMVLVLISLYFTLMSVIQLFRLACLWNLLIQDTAKSRKEAHLAVKDKPRRNICLKYKHFSEPVVGHIRFYVLGVVRPKWPHTQPRFIFQRGVVPYFARSCG